MKCPKCGHNRTRSRTRIYHGPLARTNYKVCPKCNERFPVIEWVPAYGKRKPKPS